MIKKLVFLGIALSICSHVKPMSKDTQKFLNNHNRRQEQQKIDAARHQNNNAGTKYSVSTSLQLQSQQANHNLKYGRK